MGVDHLGPKHHYRSPVYPSKGSKTHTVAPSQISQIAQTRELDNTIRIAPDDFRICIRDAKLQIEGTTCPVFRDSSKYRGVDDDCGTASSGQYQQ